MGVQLSQRPAKSVLAGLCWQGRVRGGRVPVAVVRVAGCDPSSLPTRPKILRRRFQALDFCRCKISRWRAYLELVYDAGARLSPCEKSGRVLPLGGATRARKAKFSSENRIRSSPDASSSTLTTSHFTLTPGRGYRRDYICCVWNYRFYLSYIGFTIYYSWVTTPMVKRDLTASELSLSQFLDALEKVLESFTGGNRCGAALPFQCRLQTSYRERSDLVTRSILQRSNRFE